MIPGLGGNVARFYYSPLADAYAGKGTADLGLADTGQFWMTNSGGTGGGLSVISNKLSNTGSGAEAVAGYITANLGANVAQIGATFTLAAGANGGAVALVIWQTILAASMPIPSSPLHLVITKDNWSLGWWERGVGLHNIDNAAFGSPLTDDGTTVYSIDVAISGTTATITLPDASVVTPSDSHIASLAGPFACFEVYQGDASVDGKGAFVTVSAST